MECGGEKPTEGMEEVGSYDKYFGKGRINHAFVRNLIQGGDTGGSSLLVGDVGYDPLHGKSTGVLPE